MSDESRDPVSDESREPEPERSPESRPDEESLAEAFRAVSHRLRQLSRDAMAPWDVTPSQGRALGTLGHAGPLRLRELADRLHIAPRSATEVVDDLEALGLLARHPDPADRRATLVELTPSGRRVTGEIHRARARSASGYFARIDPTDRAELARILRLLRD